MLDRLFSHPLINSIAVILLCLGAPSGVDAQAPTADRATEWSSPGPVELAACTGATTCSAPRNDRTSRASRFASIAAPAVLGSGVGAFAGAVAAGHGMDALGYGYGPTLFGALTGAAVVGTAGSALGAYWVLDADEGRTFSRALAGAALGVLPGLGLAAVTQVAGVPAAFAGFGVGQGLTAALVLAF